MGRRWLSCAGVSLLLIAPVWMQEHVQAGDLASHLYNAWLVSLVRTGEPLGLELVPQYSNVLFDWWLEGLWRIGGPVFAEKAAVSISVLLFFWGAFFLLERLTERSAWPSAPLLAMLSYGWIYHQGFFNYYLSCAFGFWAAGLSSSKGRVRLLALPALALGAAAHLLGAAVAAGFILFRLAAALGSGRFRRWIWLAALVALLAAALAIHALLPASWTPMRAVHLLCITPFLPYGARYFLPAAGVLFCWSAALLTSFQREHPRRWLSPAGELLLLTSAAILVLPTSVRWPGTGHPLHFIDWRLACWLPVLASACVASRIPARFGAACYGISAAAYFGLLAADWIALGRAERAFHAVVRQAPPRTRIISAVTADPPGMNPLLHMIDRACIGHCYSYGNYEPPSAAFRLRALPGSPAVMDSSVKVQALSHGRFVVQSSDEPLYAVFLRSAEPFSIELRRIHAGERIVPEKVAVPPRFD